MSTETKRITPDEVVAAYARTGLRPTRQAWRAGDRCCGLGALIADRFDRDSLASLENSPAERAELIAAGLLGLGASYTRGFILGFDGRMAGSCFADMVVGHADVQAAAYAVLGAIHD